MTLKIKKKKRKYIRIVSNEITITRNCFKPLIKYYNHFNLVYYFILTSTIFKLEVI